MTLCYNLVDDSITLSLEDRTHIASDIPTKGGQRVPLSVQFHRGGIPELLPASTELLFGIKAAGKFEGTYLSSVSGTAWTRPERTFTVVDLTQNIIGATTPHGLQVGQRVTVRSTTTLPTGLEANVIYYVMQAPSTTLLLLSKTLGGDAVAITTNGTGTHTLEMHDLPYTARLSTNTTPVRTALALDGSDSNDVAAIPSTIAEIQYWPPSETLPTKSQTFSLRIANFVNQGSEVSPDEANPYPAPTTIALKEVSHVYRLNSSGLFLWNTTQNKYHQLTITGAAGAESISIGAGVD